MKTKKLSFKEISGALSRDEMKQIMAGSGGSNTYCCVCNVDGGNVTCCTGTSEHCRDYFIWLCGAGGATCSIH